MDAVAGVFRSFANARQVAFELRRMPFAANRINLLLPEGSASQAESIPASDTEQPGVGAAFGGVLGGALGLASGFELGIATTALIPGVGPILAAGAIAAAIVGVGGAATGAAIGSAVDEETTEGLPADEIFFYGDALRQGRSVVIAMARDRHEAEQVRILFARNGAESIDAARQAWWIGLREAEKEHYKPLGENFAQTEHEFQAGFVAALRRDLRGMSFQASIPALRKAYPDTWDSAAFHRGFDRGQVYVHNYENGGELPAAPSGTV